MAIIKNRNNQQKQLVKVKINSGILTQVEQYCEWSGIFDLGYFFEEAAEYIFRKDVEWRQFKKGNIPTEI
jgi:hypothetical protein